MIIGTALQQPSEVLDYDVDYSSFFSTVGGDTVSNEVGKLTVSVFPTGPSATVFKTSDTGIKIWLDSASQPEGEYKVTIKMISTGGRTKEDEIIMIIKEF